MARTGSEPIAVFLQTINPVAEAKPGDLWWDGTTFRVRVGGAPTGNPAWRDITTVAGTA
jgi:hypothetical protein